MVRFIIFTPSDGVIRAILTGDRDLAELNVRTGEALIEHDGYVSASEHRVVDGVVVPR